MAMGTQLTAQNVANYILVQCDPGEELVASHPELVSHLKLQKLLYYCQGFYLAIHNAPLFKEKILHWDHGPVIKEIYEYYKSHEAAPLKAVAKFDESILPTTAKEIIDEVLTVYGQFSAWKLRDMTHAEPPWKETKDCEEITHDLLKKYFLSRLNS